MSILFINGSPDPNGNTARLAKHVLAGRAYETVNLSQNPVGDYGTSFPGDCFEAILGKMQAADIIVMGSPCYWHDLSGALRCLIDRCYGPVAEGSFSGKKLVFVFQGAAPTKAMFERVEYTMFRFAGLYGMDYLGMVTNDREAKTVARTL